MDFAIKLLVLAGVQGLGPQSAPLESVMLPLHHTPINGRRGGIWTLGSNKEQRISNPPHSATMRPLYKMELVMRLERMTSPVPRVCSTDWANESNLAEVAGFEPAIQESKSRALTSWLHLNFIIPSVLMKMVGVEGFEPPTFCSQSRRTTKLSYTPKWWVFKDLNLGLLIYETSALTNWTKDPNYLLSCVFDRR